MSQRTALGRFFVFYAVCYLWGMKIDASLTGKENARINREENPEVYKQLDKCLETIERAGVVKNIIIQSMKKNLYG